MTVGAIAANTTQALYITPMTSGFKTLARNWGNMVLGVDQSEKFSEELQNRVRGIKNAAGKYENARGFNKLGGSISEAWEESKTIVKDKKIGQVIKDSFKDVPNEFKELKDLPKFFGKEGKLWKGLKIFGKRFPLIGNIVGLAFAIPNIYKAFTDPDGGGLIPGLLETGKELASQAGFATGMAIGQALIPIPLLGGMIGGMIGGKIVERLVGKTFTEQQEEKKKKAEEKNAPTPVPAPTPSPVPTPTATPTPTAENSQVASTSPGNFFANPSLLNNNSSNIDLSDDIMASKMDWTKYPQQTAAA